MTNLKQRLGALSLRRLSENEKEGVKIAFRFMLKHPVVLSTMMVTGLLAAVFEGGTIGLLGLAVSLLGEGESAGYGIEMPLFIKQFIDDRFGAISQGIFVDRRNCSGSSNSQRSAGICEHPSSD